AATAAQRLGQAAESARAHAGTVKGACEAMIGLLEQQAGVAEELAAGAARVQDSVRRIAAGSPQQPGTAEAVASLRGDAERAAGSVSAFARRLAAAAQELQLHLKRFKV
ncbi:MAG TPA: hypothetical protein VF234_08000, partial [Limnochordia bacterium]